MYIYNRVDGPRRFGFQIEIISICNDVDDSADPHEDEEEEEDESFHLINSPMKSAWGDKSGNVVDTMTWQEERILME